MYENMSDDCKRSLKRQFDFSLLELDQMEKFISENMDKTAKEILENLMDDDDLNHKQKVIVSYTLGASVGAESARQDIESIRTTRAESMAMKIGQGG